jgi:hypothetical protein
MEAFPIRRSIRPRSTWKKAEVSIHTLRSRILILQKCTKYDHQPGKAIDVLNKLVKLPNRVYDDAAIKEEGKQLLQTMQ